MQLDGPRRCSSHSAGPVVWCLHTAGMKRLSGLLCVLAVQAAATTHTPDLTALGKGGAGWEVMPAEPFALAADAQGAQKAVQSNPVALAYVAGLEMAEGSIEFDVRGRPGDQASFVGVAFHGIDGTTHDAVYFRTFNFGHADPVKRRHAVQYIAHPDWPWFRLRKERTDEFEKAVTPEPKPAEWFHARVTVGGGRVRAYVNGSAEPSLDVPKLNDRRTGKVGVWFSGYGDIANLKITPKS